CIPKGDIKPHSSQGTCPDEWIFYRKKCYFFSKEEKDWNSSRHICLTQHAALTGIDDQIEMVFLLKHKCTGDHWIGLEIKSTTEKETWYYVSGNEGCGYLHENGVATARCYTERKWICEKNVHCITISDV
ncbi:C-type lectin domain family 2 member B-like, partial [Talpa occidentalis]|uniref:C-type lectin domain family 2 member B-like n=1 Tax=Talpa occidentalis TaxID=50954 RepID=UPI0023F82DFC